MSDLSNLWSSISRPARWSLAIAVLLIVASMIAATVWALRTPYGVLFSGLADRDSAVLVQELDRLKIPYHFSEDGKAILVPETRVHKTRLALMAKPLPLHGTVGLELFNNADFGVSDYVQRINFLRAQQGELTRTIVSIEQIESARVHLALPEQALFKKDQNKAKASVTLAMKPGKNLSPAQVAGIQRLVSASVAEVQAEDVTILDQSGNPMSAPSGAEAGGTLMNSRVDLENHLAEKANTVLDQWLGPGQAVVSVTAALSAQQARVVKEEMLPATPAQGDQLAAGVLVRERNVTKDPSGGEGAGQSKAGGGSTSIDRDYASGKRVEQTTIPAGALNRLHVAVVIKRPLSDGETAHAKELVAAAVGLQGERGDVLALHSVESSLPTNGVASVSGTPNALVNLSGPSTTPANSPKAARSSDGPSAAHTETQALNAPSAIALLIALVLFVLTLVVAWRRRPVAGAESSHSTRNLTPGEREAVLMQLRQWMGENSAAQADSSR